jgi:hypothetical protein
VTIRVSFVEHFGEEAATRVEEAALMHLGEGPVPHLDIHADDRWGDDPFCYLFLVCIGRDCFTRWRAWHRIDAEYEEILAWCLEFGDIHDFKGDLPDYLALMAGAYNPWINWQKTDMEEPEGTAEMRERNIDWAHMSEVEFQAENIANIENLRALSEKGLSLLHGHDEEGPLES